MTTKKRTDPATKNATPTAAAGGPAPDGQTEDPTVCPTCGEPVRHRTRKQREGREPTRCPWCRGRLPAISRADLAAAIAAKERAIEAAGVKSAPPRRRSLPG